MSSHELILRRWLQAKVSALFSVIFETATEAPSRMDLTSVSQNAVTIITSFIGLVSAINENKKLGRINRALLRSVQTKLDSRAKQFETLRNYHRTRESSLPEPVKVILAHTYENMQLDLDCTSSKRDEIEVLYQRCSARLRFVRFRAAHELNVKLDSLREVLDNLEPAITRALNIVNAVQPAEINTSMPSTPADDEYVATFSVPENESPAVLDFSENSGTPESSLKHLVLSGSRCDTITTFGRARHCQGSSAFVAHGMGGVGKTFALRALGLDDDIRAHFDGGVYFMTFGHDADKRTLISSLSKIVRHAGGRMRSRVMASLGNIDLVQMDAVEWFRGKRCLYIADDIWQYEEQSDGFLSVLKALLDPFAGSRLLFSTRSRFISNSVSSEARVEFSPRDRTGSLSVSVLCQNANFNLQAVQDGPKVISQYFTKVLERCNGLPLALAMAGRSVREVARTCDDLDKNQAWMLYYNETFEDKDADSGLLTARIPGFNNYPGLGHICENGLKQLDRTELRTTSQTTSPRELYYRLAVAEKQQWMPVHVLRRLWGTSSDIDALQVASSMADLELCKISRRRCHNIVVAGLTIHDLQHDFCEHMARQKNLLEKAHATLLDGYRPQQDAGIVRDWWSEDFARDDYIHKNLARHLISCGLHEELEGLLLDYRWTQRQTTASGLGLLGDFSIMGQELERHLEHDRRRCVENKATELERRVFALCRIRRSFYHSWTYVAKNNNELPTRMYGLLFTMRAENRWIASYLDSLEKQEKLPWLKTVIPCMEIPKDDMLARWNVGKRVYGVATVDDSARIVFCGDNHMLSLMDCKTGSELQRFNGHKGVVTCHAVTADGGCVISGSEDGTLRIWDVANGEVNLIVNLASGVSSLSLSGDGRKVVFGCRDGSLGVMRFPNVDDRVCTMTFGNSAQQQQNQECWPVVAINEDGAIVASGSMDGIVRLWDGVTGLAIGRAMCGDAKSITCVAISRDGSRIVSGGNDGVYVWDVSRCIALAGPLDDSEMANSMALSTDELRIAVGHRNGDISVYDADSYQSVRERLRGHTKSVESITFGVSNSMLISGSEDCTIRLWNCRNEGPKPLPDGAVHESRCPYQQGNQIALLANDAIIVVTKGWTEDNLYEIVLYNAETCDLVGELTLATSVISVFSSDDGAYIGAVCEASILAWNIRDCATPRKVFEQIAETKAAYECAAFSADNARLAAVLEDGSVKIWSITDGHCVQEISSGGFWLMEPSELRALAFPSDVFVEESNPLDQQASGNQIYVNHSEFFVRTSSSDVKVLSPPQDQIYDWNWVFDRVRGQLWLASFEGLVFVARLENCPRDH